jgi:hypothetical protein
MDYYNIIDEFINDLQMILNDNAPEIDRNIIDDIKVDASEALNKILVKYKLIEP